jgi:hypothetical protein
LTNLNLANQLLRSVFTISVREGCRADVLEPALPIGPVSLTFELGLEGCFPLHPAPFRNFGGARRSVFLSDLRRVFLFRSPVLWAVVLARTLAARPKFRADQMLFCGIPEQLNFTGTHAF